MSAVTLETLEADLDRHGDLLDAHESLEPEDYQNDPAWQVWCDEADRLFAIYQRKYETYHLAMRHGIEAAMLFKLSGGNIDPRVSA